MRYLIIAILNNTFMIVLSAVDEGLDVEYNYS